MQCYTQFECCFQSLFEYKCLVYRVCVCDRQRERHISCPLSLMKNCVVSYWHANEASLSSQGRQTNRSSPPNTPKRSISPEVDERSDTPSSALFISVSEMASHTHLLSYLNEAICSVYI